MLLVRSWPAFPPYGHARVEDGMARVEVDGFDYRPLAELGDDVVHVDWDTAVSLEDLREFARLARADPGVPLVAPMREYPGGLHGTTVRQLARPVWNVRRYEGETMRECGPGDATCHLFGFGMVYLPRLLAVEHVAALGPDEPFTDIGFSGWYAMKGAVSTVVAWAVRPVHLNYPVPYAL